ncbi:MAG: TldD/PmbA family protein [Acidobacteria bacterium]|nr:TldD/PmbA family protein [Acidobacteriota bacterium]
MPESELLTRAECRRVFEAAQRAARTLGVRDVEVTLGATASALTRFANNAIHQNVAEQRGYLSVRVLADHRTARASLNRLDDAAVAGVVEQAAALARAQAPDPEWLPLAEPAQVAEADRWSPATAASTPAQRAAGVAEALGVVESAGQTAAGIYSAAHGAEAILNSRGVFAYYADTLAHFSITAMDADSSGWAKAGAPDVARISPVELARRASAKAALSRRPRELPPGRYTVILEHAAVQDLVGQMFWDFSGTAMRDQRSFLTGRLGEKLFGENISIADDVYHPLQSGAPFDSEGIPRRRLALVERGVPREVAYSRAAAQREGRAPTGHGFPIPNEYGEAPLNIVMEGASTSLEEMIATTPRGILVTRLWYIREVDPYEKIMTGMTRDGTFLIEDGELVCGVKNLRFNQSLLEMLSSVDQLSPAARAAGEESFDMVAPALKVREFNFTEVTRF